MGNTLVLLSLYGERRAHLCAQGIAWDEGPKGDGDEMGYQAFVYCYHVDLASFWETMAFNETPALAASIARARCTRRSIRTLNCVWGSNLRLTFPAVVDQFSQIF